LNAFLAPCDSCVGKKILEIIDKGVNSETEFLLEHWSFHGQSVDKA